MDRGACWATVQWDQEESDMTGNGARMRVHNFPFQAVLPRLSLFPTFIPESLCLQHCQIQTASVAKGLDGHD